MEFIYKNFLITTSSIDTDSGTNTFAYLFDNDYNIGWASVGYNNDAVSCQLNINFDATTAVDRIAIMNHNIKQFRLFYNGVTANTFTPDMNFTQNSDTSHYLSFTQVNCTSVSIQMDSTIVTDNEKEIGEFIVSKVGVNFERNPNASGYKPKIDRIAIEHKLSDGGITQHVVADRFSCDINYSFITLDFYKDLKGFYDLMDPFIFVAFPTLTLWDGICYKVNWVGDLKLRAFSSESPDSGYDIDIKLREVSS